MTGATPQGQPSAVLFVPSPVPCPSGAPSLGFQELADEAFADLLKKHGRPIDLKPALRQSVGEIGKRPPSPSVRRRDARKAHKGE
jgi:hypothetical protein